jgi:hypothetical protein
MRIQFLEENRYAVIEDNKILFEGTQSQCEDYITLNQN